MSTTDFLDLFSMIFFVPVFLFLLIVIFYGIPSFFYYRIRRKGLIPPAAWSIIVLGVVLCLTIVNVKLSANSFWIKVILFYLLFLSINFIILYFIPDFNERKYGIRTTIFPWKIIGRVVQVVSICLAILFFYLTLSIDSVSGPKKFKIISKLVTMGIMYGYAIYRFGVLFSNQGIKYTKDNRRPVLYLRSFNLELDIFWLGYFKKVQSDVGELMTFSMEGVFKLLTFDDYFGNQVKLKIGNFIALGNPVDYVPKEMVAVDYYDDRFWQARFKEKLNESSCILMQMSDTENLEYELREILKEGFSNKLFIFTKPKQNKVYTFFMRFFNFVRATNPIDWGKFKQILIKTGFNAEINAPLGSVVSFDEYGNAFIVASNLYLPSEYIDAVKKQMNLLNL